MKTKIHIPSFFIGALIVISFFLGAAINKAPSEFGVWDDPFGPAWLTALRVDGNNWNQVEPGTILELPDGVILRAERIEARESVSTKRLEWSEILTQEERSEIEKPGEPVSAYLVNDVSEEIALGHNTLTGDFLPWQLADATETANAETDLRVFITRAGLPLPRWVKQVER